MPSEPLVVVVTGSTGGIGLHTALGLAKTGARVILTGRNPERGQAALQRFEEQHNVELALGDVSSRAGVEALAQKILALTNKVDVLINNAGYLGSEYKTSEDGLEMHFEVNVRSPWLLTQALLPALQASSEPRVVNVTGGEETPGAIDVDNLQAEKGFRGLMTYGHSKSIAEGMSMALADQLQKENISVHVVFPGRASTSMTGSLSLASLPGWMKVFYPIFWLMFRDDGGKSAEKAATSSIWAATSADLKGVSGKYYDSTTQERPLDPTAYDPEVQSKIISLIEGASH